MLYVAMNITELSDEIYREISYPTDFGMPYIASWLRANIGELNILTYECVSVDGSTLEFSPELSTEQAAIFKSLFVIKYYDKRIRENLGSGAFEIKSVKNEDGAVEYSTKTDKAKVYAGLKKDIQTNLDKLVKTYNAGRSLPRDQHSDGIPDVELPADATNDGTSYSRASWN